MRMIPDAMIIGLRADGRLLHNIWSKLDLIVPYDWENDRLQATVEVELGKMSTFFFGLYVSGLTGIQRVLFVNSSIEDVIANYNHMPSSGVKAIGGNR